MKGGGGYFYGLKMKQLSLFFIAFVCASIVVWNWEKTPRLIASLPPHDQALQIFPDEVEMKHATQIKDDSVEDEHVIDTSPPSISTNTASLNTRQDDSTVTSQENHHEDTTIVVEQSSEGDNVSEPVKQKLAEESEVREHIDTPMTKLEKQDCNFGKGKWVPAENRPLYSGFGCKQWLSGMWACRLTQRTDFGYEKLKWQPKDCEMEDFTRDKFLKRMQDKTLAFVGDSLGRQQFQSLMCMATGGEEMPNIEDVGHLFGLTKAVGSSRPDGWAYRFPTTNTTILYYWSATLSDIQPINPTENAMHLDRPPTFLKLHLHKIHVLVLNTGHHWNRGKLNANKWIMHVNEKPVQKLNIGSAKNITIYSVVKWVDGELGNHPGLKVFLRSISPRHFFNGEWNTGGTCDSTTPGALEVGQDESSDPVASGAVKGTGVKLLDITGLSLVREEGHISRYSIRAAPGMQDCLHWCLPGVPDTWNEILFAQI